MFDPLRRFAPIGASLLIATLAACAKPVNTPQDAFVTLRTAIAEERWELFYDVLLPEARTAYDELIAAKDTELAAIARQSGPSAADALLAPIGLTYDGWKALDARRRFAGIFSANARPHFMNMGLNEDHLRAAEVRSSESHGGVSTLVVDDGKGHRTRLRFKLVDGAWRFDPGDA